MSSVKVLNVRFVIIIISIIKRKTRVLEHLSNLESADGQGKIIHGKQVR